MLTPSPIRVAVLASQRAPGLAHLLGRASTPGASFQVVGCVNSEEVFRDAELTVRHRVPLIHHPVQAFYAVHAPGARLSDRRVREDYDRRTVELLGEFRPDVVVLAGYLLMLTGPMLTAFNGRILNVHHSDLLLRNASGGPRYPGLRAVRDAILAGEPETRSTAHLVTERLDDGPPLLRSWSFPVAPVITWARTCGEQDVLKPLIWTHQEWMLRSAFGPLMEHGIGMVTQGIVNSDRELSAEDGRRALAWPGAAVMHGGPEASPLPRLMGPVS